MENRAFKLAEIIKIFDIKQHFVIHLVETGVIKPLEDARGRGKSRRYSYLNLVEIGIFTQLTKLKISHVAAAQLIEAIRGISMSEPRTIKKIPYIHVMGLLAGEKIITFPLPFSQDRESSPGKSLDEFIKAELIKTEGDELLKQKKRQRTDFSYYFILDVKNIIAYINERIRAL